MIDEYLGMKARSIYKHQINGLAVQTGDILCTTTGNSDLEIGHFWRFLGRLVPGEVDHVAVYIGPGGRFVESCGKGVIEFSLTGQAWVAERLRHVRGGLIDQLFGVAYPLAGKGFTAAEERAVRTSVAEYCLAQAQAGKPYNLNFLDSDSEDAFYCSQLAYKAYLPHGVDLNTGQGVPDLPGTDRIIFPQEIWSGCAHKRV